MPFHLPPISRRQFLAHTVLATTAGLLAPLRSAHADEPVIDPDRWALFSDTHISADTAAVFRGEPMYANGQRVNEELLALKQRPVGMIHLGDCAFKDGLPGDYAVFESLLKPLAGAGLDVHLALGNHDDRDVFWRALEAVKDRPRPLANRHVSIIEHPRANWFLLDSLTEVGSKPGEIAGEQLAWLTQELDARADRPALVGLHHNPTVDPKTAVIAGFGGAEALLKSLNARRQVKALFYGHSHRWSFAKYGDLHLINLPAVGYPTKSGDTTSGWVECQLRADEMQLILHARDRAHPDHLRPIDLVWRGA